MTQFRRLMAGDPGIDASESEKPKTSDPGFEISEFRELETNNPEMPAQQDGGLTMGGPGMPPQKFNGPMPGGPGMPSQKYTGPMMPPGGPNTPLQQFNGPMMPGGSGGSNTPQQFNGPMMPGGPNMPSQQFGRPPLNNRMTDTPPPAPVMNGGGGQPPNNYPYGSSSNFSPTRERPRNRSMVILAGVCIAAVVFAGLFFAYNNLKTPSVTLYQAKQQTVNRSVGGSGVIYPITQLAISFPNVARVSDVVVKPGDTVKKNDKLITIDLTQLDTTINQAQANVTATQTLANSLAGTAQGPAAQERATEANNAYQALIAEKNSPILQNGSLVAPYDAVVTQVNINPGEVAAANAPLVTLQVQSTVIARVQIPLAYARDVTVNQAAVVTPSAFPDINLTGKVISVIPQASQNSDTFEVWISLPNDNLKNNQQKLLPGMSTFARLQAPVTAIVIPRLAVLNPDQNSAVFVVRNSHAYEKPVQIVGYVDNNVILQSGGVADGDEVVLTGVDTLHDGQAVKVTSVEQPKP